MTASYYQRFKTLQQRFDEKYMPEPNSGCWLWIAVTRGVPAYGAIKVNGKTVKAHRVSWELANGPIPEGEGYHGICVLHRCDNPLCVNPDHLFLGSNRDNQIDCSNKGRNKQQHGGENSQAKLSNADAEEIREHYDYKQFTMREIGDYYGVAPQTINRVVHYQRYGGI